MTQGALLANLNGMMTLGISLLRRLGKTSGMMIPLRPVADHASPILTTIAIGATKTNGPSLAFLGPRFFIWEGATREPKWRWRKDPGTSG
jgi:hypothetical protein